MQLFCTYVDLNEKVAFYSNSPRPHFQKTSPKLKIATHKFRMKTFTVTCGFCVSLFTTKIAEEKKKNMWCTSIFSKLFWWRES